MVDEPKEDVVDEPKEDVVDEPTEDEASADNRRRYERVRVTKPLKLEATLRGRFIDIMRIEMTGVTIDMSKGGILANVDQSISPGVRCRVDLTAKDGSGPTETLWARVRRTDMSKNGFVVALEFDEPVKALAALGAPIDIDAAKAAAEANNGDGEYPDELDEDEAVEAAAEEDADQKPASKRTRRKRAAGRKKITNR